MDDELEMDASGCWVRKNARVISDTPLRSQIEQYNRLAFSLDAKDTVDGDKQEDVVIIF